MGASHDTIQYGVPRGFVESISGLYPSHAALIASSLVSEHLGRVIIKHARRLGLDLSFQATFDIIVMSGSLQYPSATDKEGSRGRICI